MVFLQADEAVLPGDAASKLEDAAEISVGFQRLNPKKSKENDEDNDPDWDPKPVEKIISPKKTYENQISGSTNNGTRKRPNIDLVKPGKIHQARPWIHHGNAVCDEKLTGVTIPILQVKSY